MTKLKHKAKLLHRARLAEEEEARKARCGAQLGQLVLANTSRSSGQSHGLRCPRVLLTCHGRPIELPLVALALMKRCLCRAQRPVLPLPQGLSDLLCSHLIQHLTLSDVGSLSW